MTCIFLSAPYFASGQELGSADSLLEAGNYLQARVAYERLLFHGKSDANILLLKKSFCWKMEGKFDEAHSTLLRADLFKGTDSVKIMIYNELALDAYLAGKFNIALSTLQELHYYFPDQSTSISEALEILTLNQLFKWDEAEQKFISFLAKYALPDQYIYQKRNRPKFKNPTKAETLSYIIPGSGQLYAGYPGHAITSLLIQGGLVTFTVYSFTNGYFFSGAFTGVALFSFFYNGGARHARDLAVRHNSEQLFRFNEKVKTVLMDAIKK